jgi:hypothetical protein
MFTEEPFKKDTPNFVHIYITTLFKRTFFPLVNRSLYLDVLQVTFNLSNLSLLFK